MSNDVSCAAMDGKILNNIMTPQIPKPLQFICVIQMQIHYNKNIWLCNKNYLSTTGIVFNI